MTKQITINRNDLRRRLMMAQVASCKCMTKAHYWDAHTPECLYRILWEAVFFLNQEFTPAEIIEPSSLPSQQVEPVELLEIDYSVYEKWLDTHYRTCRSPTFEQVRTRGAIGTTIIEHCGCGATCDITNYDAW